MRAVSIVPFGASGLLLPKWPTNSVMGPTVWNFSGAALASAAINGLASNCGFAAAASDGAGNAWLAQYTGSLVFYSSGGGATGYALPGGNVYTGCAYVPASGLPYVVTASGALYAGSGAVLVNSGFPNVSMGLVTSGVSLFSLTAPSTVGPPTTVYLTSGTTTWTVPAGFVASGATIEAVGPGGSGSTGGTPGGGGGQGGGYGKVSSPANIVAGNVLTVQIGNGGSANATFLKDNTGTTIVQGDYGANGVSHAGGSRSQVNTGSTVASGGSGGGAGVTLGGAGGGGGAGGPVGVGAAGGTASNVNHEGGGGGGGADGGSVGSPNSTTTGGNGGNNSNGGGAGTGGASGLAGGNATGQLDFGGAGGGGGGGNGGSVSVGGSGAPGEEWDSTHGSGGGGGGAGQSAVGGAGGFAGGGGGGGAGGNLGGVGGNGLLKITWNIALPSGHPYQLGVVALTGPTSGTASLQSFPTALLNGLCLAASTAASAVAVGGWSPYTLGSGYVNLAFNPTSPVMIGLNGVGHVDIYQGPSEVWTQTGSAAVSGAPKFGAWTPNGNSVLLSDPVSGIVQVFNYSLGNLTAAQTLPIANASSIAITPDGTKALVCRPTSNLVTPLTLSGSVWVTGAALAIGSPQSVVAKSSTAAAVGCSSGLALLAFTSSWAVSASAALSYIPTYLLFASGAVLAAGASGASGFFSAVSGTSGLFNTSWAGTASGMIYEQGQITVSDPVSQLMRCFGNTFQTYGSIFNVAPSAPFNNIQNSPATPLSSGGTIFGMTSGALTYLYYYRSPFSLEPLRSGVVSVLTSGGWASAVLGSGHVPTALTFDTSGNVWAATLQNTLHEVGLNGASLSTSTITQFPGQNQNTPLGVSAMIYVGPALYAASSLAGPLAKLI